MTEKIEQNWWRNIKENYIRLLIYLLINDNTFNYCFVKYHELLSVNFATYFECYINNNYYNNNVKTKVAFKSNNISIKIINYTTKKKNK